MTRGFGEVTVVVVAMVALVGCGKGNDDGEDFGNLIASAQGTQLTRAEHPTGWGQTECFLCHPVDETHKVDHSGTGTLPLDDIRRLVDRQGRASCHLCHGNNGVDQ